jgi:hypothetical protein
MAALVSLAAFEAFLGGAEASENMLRQGLLDDVEALFLSECGRTRTPFAIELADRAEHLRGTGSDTLHLSYPIADVTEILLGYDSADPDDTLDPDDKTVVVWEVGGQAITRVDGGRWGLFAAPAYCHITYDSQADLPADASLAVMRVAAAVYRQRGAEDAQVETIGGQQYNAAKVAESDPVWLGAVANHRRASL